MYLTDSEEDEDMIDGHHDESSSSDGSDGEARVGRGSKRKARPLGFRWVTERCTSPVYLGCSGRIVHSSLGLMHTVLVCWKSSCGRGGVHPVQ